MVVKVILLALMPRLEKLNNMRQITITSEEFDRWLPKILKSFTEHFPKMALVANLTLNRIRAQYIVVHKDGQDKFVRSHNSGQMVQEELKLTFSAKGFPAQHAYIGCPGDYNVIADWIKLEKKAVLIPAETIDEDDDVIVLGKTECKVCGTKHQTVEKFIECAKSTKDDDEKLGDAKGKDDNK